MNKDNYITLIYKKLKREITPTEQESLNQWLVEKAEHLLLQQQLEENWQQSKTILPPLDIDTKADFQGFKKRMQAHKGNQAPSREAAIKPLNSRRILLAIAAAIAIPLLAAVWLFRPAPSPTMMMAQTTAAETKVINLTDGTIITLNENSTLSYPETFATNDRQVLLNGEAYFEVESDPSRPFEVLTEKASVKVLGTVFNVRTIGTEDKIKVSVEEGKVQFSSTLIGKGVILTKGEEGTYDLTKNEITAAKVDNRNASAWKTKNLTYKNAPLKTVVADLAQHFKVKTTITNVAMQECRLTASFVKATPMVVFDYLVELYQMELVQIDSQSFELNNGTCQ